MKWARDIENFFAREREKFSAAQAHRRPDRNVCCKCAYDLAGVAEPPPTPAPPDLKCPECGAAVSLRDHWRTDGRYSMDALLIASWGLTGVLLAIAMTPLTLRPANDTSPHSWHPVNLIVMWVIWQVVLFTAAVVVALCGAKGVAMRAHITRRCVAVLTPIVVAMAIGHIVRWITP